MKAEVLRRLSRCCAAFAAVAASFTAPLGASLAPGWVIESWTAKNGLPSNSINDLLEARDGYLWMATWNGLARFDGARFTIYNTTSHPELPSNRITSIRQAREGTLWLSTEQHHLVRYQSGRFTTLGEIHSFYQEPDGTLWAGGNNGAARLAGGQVEPVVPELLNVRVLSILRDRDGALWFGTSFAGVKRLAEGRLTTWSAGEGLAAREVLALQQTASGEILAGTTEGLFRHAGGRWERIDAPSPIGHAAVFAIERGEGDQLWLATANGIVRLDREGFHAETSSAPWLFRRDRPFRRDLKGAGWVNRGNLLVRGDERIFETSDVITSTLHDREGNVWIGTWQSGLHRIRASRFTIYGKEHGLRSDNIYPIYQDRAGTIWAGTLGGGLARLAGARFVSDADPAIVYSIAHDSSGTMWIGSDRLCQYANGVCSTAAIPPPARDAVEVRAIFEDSRRRLWVGSRSGLLVRDGLLWKRYGAADGVPDPMVRVISESADGTVWLGTNGGGLLRFARGRFQRLTTAHGLPSNLIRSIHEQPAGTVWVGTEDKGLARIRGASITVIDTQGGLFADGIHQILPDRQGRLWMSSNEGIFHVKLVELQRFGRGAARVQSIAYTARDGIPEANGGVQSAGIRSSDGRLWFPTQAGVAVIDPEGEQLPQPPVFVESLQSEQEVFGARAGIELAPGQRSFQIDYTAISFADAGRLRFRYRLDGFDTSWVDAGERRSAFYTKVPAGHYRFQVQARHADGSWTAGGEALEITVAPYFRETIWFLLLLVAAVAALVVGGTLWRTRRLAARQRELEAEVAHRTDQLEREKVRAELALAKVEEQNEALGMLDTMKTRFFADVSHELRTPLTLILGPLTDLIDEKHGQVSSPMQQRLTVMKRNALRLHWLVNQMLDLHRLESGGLRLDKQTRDFGPFVRDVASAFLPLAERHRIALEVDVDDRACPVSFDGDQMEKVVANLLSNAMKFAPPGGSIRLVVRQDADHVILAVSDDGSGIPAEEIPYVFDRFYRGTHASVMREGTGIGLALVRELVQQHGGAVEVQSRPHVETIFTVRLPRSDEIPVAPDEGVGRDRPLVDWMGLEERRETRQHEDATTVMVVDDNSDVRNYIAGILEDRYRVVAAADGRQALVKAADELPDLIISDVLMPHLDGLSLVSALRANPDTECIPVILLTALAGSRDEVAGIQTGADEYLVKPFSSEALRARVDGLLAQRHRLRVKMRAELLEEYAHRQRAPSPPGSVSARARAFIREHVHDDDLTVERLAAEMAMSRSTLHRALQQEATTASELLRVTRLERAAELLAAQTGSVSEIAWAVGFQSLSHFSRSFRVHFGIPPSQHASMAAQVSALRMPPPTGDAG